MPFKPTVKSLLFLGIWKSTDGRRVLLVPKTNWLPSPMAKTQASVKLKSRSTRLDRLLATTIRRCCQQWKPLSKKYVFRDDNNKRDLVVSNKGIALCDLLNDVGLKVLGSPEMTGEWEYKLKQMEQGKLNRKEFMEEVKTLTKSIVKQTVDYTEEIVNRPFPDLAVACPECSAPALKQTEGLFECTNMVENPKKGKKNQPDEKPCIFRLKKHIASHELSEEQAKTLITARRVGPIESFKSRFGKPFAADLTIARQKRSWKVEFIFEGDDLREEELKNLTDDQIICEAPSGDEKSELKVKVYETERAYLAPDMAKKVDERGVRISKTILQKEIPQDHELYDRETRIRIRTSQEEEKEG